MSLDQYRNRSVGLPSSDDDDVDDLTCEYCDGPIDGDEIVSGGRVFCCDECCQEAEDATRAARAMDRELGMDFEIDGVGFADPGGDSALRAETADNPRNQPCPTCGAENVLTPADVAAGYHCNRCADRDERS